jgi:hypothetical protein
VSRWARRADCLPTHRFLSQEAGHRTRQKPRVVESGQIAESAYSVASRCGEPAFVRRLLAVRPTVKLQASQWIRDLTGVRTRYKPGTSPRFTRDSQRSRFRVCGWPVTPARSCRRLRSIVGCHCARVESVRWCASWQCSFHDRRSDRVRPAPFRSPSPPLSSTTLSFDFS